MNIEELKNKIDKKEKELKDLQEQLKAINNYETVCIINKNISLEKYCQLKKYIQEYCENIKEFDEMGIKKLAYNIKEEKEAFYLRFEWQGTPENISEIERYFRINDDVLKFINIRKNEEE